MTRMLALVAAMLLTAITVSSACLASGPNPLRFTIEPSRNAGFVEVRFRRADERHGSDSWSSSFRPTDLAGLDPAALDAAGSRPIRFAIIREAGRIDCAGNGGKAMAIGTCVMTADRGFADFLAAHGVARPTEDQTYGLIVLDVHRSLVSALAQSRYPTPTVEKLLELSAVNVTPDYIHALAAQDYRPETLDALVQFAALKITPQFIGSFARAGYSNLRPEELVQLKALNITPDFIARFDSIGYRHLPVSTLVQLKAMNITPEFVRSVAQGGPLPSPERLVQLRAIGRELRSK